MKAKEQSTASTGFGKLGRAVGDAAADRDVARETVFDDEDAPADGIRKLPRRALR
jgi:hypothetical protein